MIEPLLYFRDLRSYCFLVVTLYLVENILTVSKYDVFG